LDSFEKDFSNILDIMGKRLIGLYDVTLSGGFTRFVDHDYLGEFPQNWEVSNFEHTVVDCGQ
jgi:hypothetical protein